MARSSSSRPAPARPAYNRPAAVRTAPTPAPARKAPAPAPAPTSAPAPAPVPAQPSFMRDVASTAGGYVLGNVATRALFGPHPPPPSSHTTMPPPQSPPSSLPVDDPCKKILHDYHTKCVMASVPDTEACAELYRSFTRCIKSEYNSQ